MNRMIIIEDEPPILFMAKTVIESFNLGFEVVGYAFNGEDGEQLVRELQPDVVLTDIKMPMKDGLTLIRDLYSDGVRPEWIILSGYAEFEYALEALKHGVRDYILKPLDPNNMREVLTKLALDLSVRRQVDDITGLTSMLHYGQYSAQLERFKSKTMYPLLLVAGNASASVHDSLHAAKSFFSGDRLQQLSQFRPAGFGQSWCLEAFAENQRLLLLEMTEPPSSDSILVDAAGQLLDILQEASYEHQPALSVYAGEPLRDLSELHMRGYQLFKSFSKVNVIGAAQVYTAQSQPPALADLEELEKVCLQISYAGSYHALQAELVKFGKQAQASYCPQRAFEGMLLKLADMMHAGQSITIWDIQEAIAATVTYEEAAAAFGSLLRHRFEESAVESKDWQVGHEMVQRIAAYLETNFHLPITYDTLQDQFGYHKDYIAYLFRQMKKCSPNKYLTSIRIEKAQLWIRQDTKGSMREIAERVGYEDSLYFSKVFKSATGVSPSAYREQCLRSESSHAVKEGGGE